MKAEQSETWEQSLQGTITILFAVQKKGPARGRAMTGLTESRKHVGKAAGCKWHSVEQNLALAL